MHSGTPQRTRVHVHVPYWQFTEYLDFLREHRLSVEIFIGSHTVDNVTEAGLHGVVEAMDWEHTLSVHGPFMDLSPGAVDPKIAAASLGRYLQVMDFSEILRPDVVVFHSGYEKWKYAGNVELWLGQSVKTWRSVMDRAERLGVKVAIENIVDSEPDHLRLLAERVAHPLFGLCLDVGHREIFSTLPVTAWVEGMHPHVFELHLHDNDGKSDDHKPIGEGKVDFNGLFKTLSDLSINPVHTIEAHSAPDALKSLENLKSYIG